MKVASIYAEPAYPKADISGRVADVVIRHKMTTASVDTNPFAAPRSHSCVVSLCDVRHRSVVDRSGRSGVIVHRVDRHRVIAGAADKVIVWSEVVSDGCVQ